MLKVLPLAIFLLSSLCRAQQAATHRLIEPAIIPLRTVRDAQDHLTFQIPVNWSLATRDRELSTFRQEARTAPRAARLRFVAAMPENPYPASTFSGAHFYVSVVPGISAAQCAAQAAQQPHEGARHFPRETSVGPDNRTAAAVTIGNQPADRGHDEYGEICTQFRDDVYTMRRKNTCLRFDLALNNFCGGDVTGVRDMTHDEILDVRHQLESLLNSVVFDR